MRIVSDNFRAAAYMSLSMAGFVLNDTFMKLASEDLTLFQSILIRGLFASAFIGLWAWRKGVLYVNVSKADRIALATRMFGEIGGTLCFLTALFNMPIANATAILQALPLAVTLASSVFLKEKVGWRRYTAIAIGFAGVLIVIRPGSDGFTEYSYWALAAVVFIVIRDLATRNLSSGVPSLFVAFTAALGITCAGALLSPMMAWHPVEIRHVSMLGISALFIVGGYIFSIMTMRVGDISFASPFRYTNLIWALMLGVVIFDDALDRWTLLGSALIVGMGIYTIYRERRQQKPMAKASMNQKS